MAALGMGGTATLAQPACDLDKVPTICSIADNYDPTPPPNAYGKAPITGKMRNTPFVPPVCEIDQGGAERSGAAAGVIRQAIKWAATRPVPKFIDDVCNLNRIFVIIDNSRHSWGKWENPDFYNDAGRDQKYVAITLHDTNATLASRLDDHFSGKMKISNHHHTETIFSADNSNQLAILYTVGHEVGHLNWRNAWGKKRSDCFDLTLSWSDPANAKTRPWTEYADDLGAHNDNIPKPFAANPGAVKRIYNGGFMTALAAANPEEDFVETYSTALVKLLFLSPLSNVALSNGLLPVATVTANRPDSANKNKLTSKLQCILSALQ